ncbi:hypothetical protein F8S20_31015, partial [Nostoc sp. BAE]|nr:hypothetical protein [Nostoc commune BAE]
CYFGVPICYFGVLICYFGVLICYFGVLICYFGVLICYFGVLICYFGVPITYPTKLIEDLKGFVGFRYRSTQPTFFLKRWFVFNLTRLKVA